MEAYPYAGTEPESLKLTGSNQVVEAVANSQLQSRPEFGEGRER